MRIGILLLVTFLSVSTTVDGQLPKDVKILTDPDPSIPLATLSGDYGDSLTVQVDVDITGHVRAVRTSVPLALCTNVGDPMVEAIRESVAKAAWGLTFEPVLKKGKPSEFMFERNYYLHPHSNGPPPDKSRVRGGEAKFLPKPDYPFLGQGRAQVVNVRILIGEDGSVFAVALDSGYPPFTESAVKAACESKFTPTLLDGKPVRVQAVISYNFGSKEPTLLIRPLGR